MHMRKVFPLNLFLMAQTYILPYHPVHKPGKFPLYKTPVTKKGYRAGSRKGKYSGRELPFLIETTGSILSHVFEKHGQVPGVINRHKKRNNVTRRIFEKMGSNAITAHLNIV